MRGQMASTLSTILSSVIFVETFVLARGFAPIIASERLGRTRLSSAKNANVIVVHFDGCLVQKNDWRIQAGLDAAVQAWPEIRETIDAFDDIHWLTNKLEAVSRVLEASEKASRSVEFALCARLLLEEQLLDRGLSSGRTGKYAKRFHPRIVGKKRPQRDMSSSRPLTVGEISANWKETLRETVQIRYHCDNQNPIPILQQKIDEAESDFAAPCMDARACDALLDSDAIVIVCVGHASDLLVAESSLDASSICYRVIQDVKDAFQKDKKVFLMVRSRDTVKRVLQEAPANSTIHVVESSYDHLQQSVPLFGDYIPRNEQPAKCVAENRYLSLCLAHWGSHPSQQASATMNPWTRVVHDFSELVNPNVGVSKE